MDSLQKKTLVTSRSLKYTYYFHAGSKDKPTVVLQHGFPDNAHLWSEMLPYLIPTEYSLLIPDLLGYDGTSKPADLEFYNSKLLASDLIEICDDAGVTSIISLGHDWGSWMAQRLYLWHPDRVVGLILLNVAYLPPDLETPFDLQSVLQMQEQAFGSPLYAYWELFTAPDAAKLIENRLDSFWTIMHGDEPDWMHRMWCNRGAMREYLEADKRVPLKPYAEMPKWKDEWIARMKRDGLTAPLLWYSALTNNVSFEAEKHLSPETLVVRKPLLFIGCTGDAVCRTGLMNIPIDQGLVPNLTMKEIECAHWSPMEKPDEMGSIVASYLESTIF